MASSTKPEPSRPAMRHLGALELRQNLGGNERLALWLAYCSKREQELLVALSRREASGLLAAQDWQAATLQAGRLSHPNLAHLVDYGVEQHRPYLACDRALGLTLPEHIKALPIHPKPEAVVAWAVQLLQGMAFAHDAGVSWAELQAEQVLINPEGQVRLLAFPATPWDEPWRGPNGAGAPPSSMSAPELHRGRCQANVLMVGLLLCKWLGGRDPLDEPDVRQALGRMPPLGRENVRLPGHTPHPVPEPLRAIVNRALGAYAGQAYLSARTLLAALQGWLDAQGQGRLSPTQRVMERVPAAGVLPSLALGSGPASALDERLHTEEVSRHVLADLAFSLQVLQKVNAGASRWRDDGGIISMRRAVALLGLGGLQRCAEVLKPWPGTLDTEGAQQLRQLTVRAQRAGLVASQIRPRGYDAEVVYLVACLQNLGRLLMHYHFPSDAEQVRRMMRPAPLDSQAPPGSEAAAGLREADAVMSVLGWRLDELSAGVVQALGLGDELAAMVRAIPPDKLPSAGQTDWEILRASAWAANEAIDVASHGALASQNKLLDAICQRYGRTLELSVESLGQALAQAQDTILDDGSLRRALPLG
jgi:hypothetical protein